MSGSDSSALSAAVLKADSYDLYRRFMGSPPTIEVLIRRLKAADGIHDAVLGAFDDAHELVGVAQFDRGNEEPVAELAIEVATGWQRCGLGTVMLEALCELADTHGIAALTAFYFADNMPIIRLLHATGCSRQVDYDCGSSTAELDVRQMIEANYATAGA